MRSRAFARAWTTSSGGCRPTPAAHYRPLAVLLIGTGARISEALALTWNDIDLTRGLVHIRRQRPRHGTAPRPTKSKRQRSILIGPRLTATLTTLRPRTAGPTDWLFICPRPSRGRYANRPATDPPHRKTVHDWHERTLTQAGIRDLPLHALRHTAAATGSAPDTPSSSSSDNSATARSPPPSSTTDISN